MGWSSQSNHKHTVKKGKQRSCQHPFTLEAFCMSSRLFTAFECPSAYTCTRTHRLECTRERTRVLVLEKLLGSRNSTYFFLRRFFSVLLQTPKPNTTRLSATLACYCNTAILYCNSMLASLPFFQTAHCLYPASLVATAALMFGIRSTWGKIPTNAT